jgi:hypothetical protein
MNGLKNEDDAPAPRGPGTAEQRSSGEVGMSTLQTE